MSAPSTIVDQTSHTVSGEPADAKHPKVIKGSTDILLIAPHACIRDGEPKDDENTGPITEAVARQIGCSAIINTHYHKPDKKKYRKGYKPKINEYPYGFEYNNLNLNVIAHAEQIPGYLGAIRTVVEAPGKTTVIWIHGADDKNAIDVVSGAVYDFPADKIHAFIGYGQGKHPGNSKSKSRHTADVATVERFRDALISNGMNAVLTDDNALNYRGRSEKLMNQWFQEQKYPLDKVESIQLEIRKGDFRDLHHNIEKTAGILIDTLSHEALVPDIPEETVADEQLVDLAFNHLRGIFAKQIHEAMLQAGRYLVRTFFGTYENACNRKKIRKQSFNRLEEKLNNGNGDAPKKTWIYDAVKLAVDDHFYDFEGGELFRAYGKLGHSQKLRLAYVRHKETKENLIREVANSKDPITDRDLRERISNAKKNLSNKAKNQPLASLIENIDVLEDADSKKQIGFDELLKLPDKDLAGLEGTAKRVSKEIADQIVQMENQWEELRKAINRTIEKEAVYEIIPIRIAAARSWKKSLLEREKGKSNPDLPEDTPRLKKLRDAVQFMCFWKRISYSNLCVHLLRHKKNTSYVPFEEANEDLLKSMLRAGQCHLQATYDFEVGKDRKIKWLSHKQVQNRLDKGTFWLSREKYNLLNDPKYYDYK